MNLYTSAIKYRNSFGIYDTVAVLLVILKLIGEITWPWVVVLLPFLVPLIGAVVAFSVAGLFSIAGILYKIFTKRN